MKRYIHVLQVILEKLGVNGAKAYTDVATPYEDIITAHLSYMSSKNIVVPPIMEELPSLYWLPKTT